MKRNQILVVDDSIATRLMLSNILSANGYEVIDAENGKVALDKLNAAKKRAGMIICDYNMPLMNGPEFAAKVRNLPDYRFIKIMMLTTEEDQQKKDLAKNAGVSAWMKKSFKSESLLEAVKKLMGN